MESVGGVWCDESSVCGMDGVMNGCVVNRGKIKGYGGDGYWELWRVNVVNGYIVYCILRKLCGEKLWRLEDYFPCYLHSGLRTKSA